MLSILTTTEDLQAVNAAIASVDRLGELVQVTTDAQAVEPTNKLIVAQNGQVSKALDWYDTEPPYSFPAAAFTPDHLLASVFYSLGNHQKAFEYLTEDSPLFRHLLVATNIQFGYEIGEDLLGETQLCSHNLAVVNHYGNFSNRLALEEVKAAYENAIETAENAEQKVFSVKHFVNLLIDTGEFAQAEELIKSVQDQAISADAKNALNVQLATVLMQQLKLPYDVEKLSEIQELFQAAIAYYESRKIKVNAGLLLVDASEIANYQEDYITSKNYINKAILYFKEEEVTEFLGEAGLRKATLLYTWSKNGQPQYYKASINAFQDTLKVFKRDTHPQKFADVHHSMALIYSEIPVSPEEKAMWTAFCASSFKEALAFYTAEQYPYEHAMVSHNYATALINFPEAKLHNNFIRAADLFENALAIRTAEQFPYERASTLINQLELFWLLHNEDNADETERLAQMERKINEVKSLVDDPALLEKLTFHEAKLQDLKTAI